MFVDPMKIEWFSINKKLVASNKDGSDTNWLHIGVFRDGAIHNSRECDLCFEKIILGQLRYK